MASTLFDHFWSSDVEFKGPRTRKIDQRNPGEHHECDHLPAAENRRDGALPPRRGRRAKYSDTTVKLEAPVVREVHALLEGKQTLTAFVREAVERDVRRRKMRQAALLYRETFPPGSPEAGELDDWESAPLATEPRRVSRKK